MDGRLPVSMEFTKISRESPLRELWAYVNSFQKTPLRERERRLFRMFSFAGRCFAMRVAAD